MDGLRTSFEMTYHDRGKNVAWGEVKKLYMEKIREGERSKVK